MKISINPFTSSENEYISRTKKILGHRATLRALPGVKRAFANPYSLFVARCDVAIVHWVENTMLDRQGRATALRRFRLYLYIKAIKLISKRLIMVRHNNYPHAAQHDQIPRIKQLMQRYEKHFDVIITHSDHDPSAGYLYVPHPLYSRAATTGRLVEGEYFFILGRILPYKAIDKLIAALSPNVHLVIAGKTPDLAYLEKCKNLAKGKKVTFITGFVSDIDAANLVTHSLGMIIPNSDEDMVVSGNYFFALSYGTPIYTVQTPFTNWLKKKNDPGALQQYHSIESLADGIANFREISARDENKVEELFGDSAVARGWQLALAATGNLAPAE